MLRARMHRTPWLLATLLLAACSSPQPIADADANTPIDAATDIGSDVPADRPTDNPPPTDIAMDTTTDTSTIDAAVDDALDVFDVQHTSDREPMDVIDDEPLLFTDAGCGARYALHPIASSIHVDFDASVTYTTNPPSSGDHYGIWARWGIASMVIPREYYVHNLEHSGVVVLYRCVGDCSALRTQLTNLITTLPPETTCVMEGGSVLRRIILTEDPLIDTPIAAAAWGATYHADCFDETSLRAFILGRTGRGPENFCAEGFYP